MSPVQRTARGERGFTLVELAIALVILALLLTATLKGQSLIQAAKIDSVVAMEKDIATAVRVFKERYHYLPGDFPAEAEIAGVSPKCLKGVNPNGNGRIETANSEVACVAEHLIRAGLLTGDPNGELRTEYGPVTVVQWADSQTKAARDSAGLPALVPAPIHVIEFANLPCDVAKGVDTKLDDGTLGRGGVIGAQESCSGEVVSFVAVGL